MEWEMKKKKPRWIEIFRCDILAPINAMTVFAWFALAARSYVENGFNFITIMFMLATLMYFFGNYVWK